MASKASTSYSKTLSVKATKGSVVVLNDRFDSTLAKYKPQSVPSTATEITPISTPKTRLSELWEQYTEFRRPQVAQTTSRIQYAAVASHIRRLPIQSLDGALEVRDVFLKTLTLDTTRRTITQISACCDWAVESGLIAVNPFRGMAEKIKLITRLGMEKEEVARLNNRAGMPDQIKADGFNQAWVPRRADSP